MTNQEKFKIYTNKKAAKIKKVAELVRAGDLIAAAEHQNREDKELKKMIRSFIL